MAIIPKYAHSTDAGMDLVAVSMNETDKYIEYDTGIALEIPKGYVGLVFLEVVCLNWIWYKQILLELLILVIEIL